MEEVKITVFRVLRVGGEGQRPRLGDGQDFLGPNGILGPLDSPSNYMEANYKSEGDKIVTARRVLCMRIKVCEGEPVITVQSGAREGGKRKANALSSVARKAMGRIERREGDSGGIVLWQQLRIWRPRARETDDRGSISQAIYS